MNEYELRILQEIINEEILSYLESGYKISDCYIRTLREILKKLNLKEVYNFEKWRKLNGN